MVSAGLNGTGTPQPSNPAAIKQPQTYKRKLASEGKVILGLNQMINGKCGYVNSIGRTHLAENAFTSKRLYDELDVVNFDNNQFMRSLQEPGVPGPLEQQSIQSQKSPLPPILLKGLKSS